MKKAIDYLHNLNVRINHGENASWTEAIEQAQKDAYNQAIDDAVNSVKVVKTKKLNFEIGKWENVPLVDQTSILKLKK